MAVQTVNRVVPEASFASLYTFPFDPFQIEAMDDIAAGRSVLVSAPTSAGKTVIAEYALWRTTRAGQRAIYTTPIKALSNQKRRDLDRLFPGRIGLLTGDRSENRDADILVMTTEVLRNMLLEDPESLRQVSCVVFDEVHYIADPERGTIWRSRSSAPYRRCSLYAYQPPSATRVRSPTGSPRHGAGRCQTQPRLLSSAMSSDPSRWSTTCLRARDCF